MKTLVLPCVWINRMHLKENQGPAVVQVTILMSPIQTPSIKKRHVIGFLNRAFKYEFSSNFVGPKKVRLRESKTKK